MEPAGQEQGPKTWHCRSSWPDSGLVLSSSSLSFSRLWDWATETWFRQQNQVPTGNWKHLLETNGLKILLGSFQVVNTLLTNFILQLDLFVPLLLRMQVAIAQLLTNHVHAQHHPVKCVDRHDADRHWVGGKVCENGLLDGGTLLDLPLGGRCEQAGEVDIRHHQMGRTLLFGLSHLERLDCH